jgi:hypothetical protein
MSLLLSECTKQNTLTKYPFCFQNVQNNGSLYIHVYFVKEGKSPNPKDKGSYLKKYTVYNSKSKF